MLPKPPEDKWRVYERVAKGAALLDQQEPGWRDRIEVELLNMASPNSCILGQAFQSWFDENGYDASYSNGYDVGVGELGIDPESYGFESSQYEDSDGEFALLGLAWEQVLQPERFVPVQPERPDVS